MFFDKKRRTTADEIEQYFRRINRFFAEAADLTFDAYEEKSPDEAIFLTLKDLVRERLKALDHIASLCTDKGRPYPEKRHVGKSVEHVIRHFRKELDTKNEYAEERLRTQIDCLEKTIQALREYLLQAMYPPVTVTVQPEQWKIGDDDNVQEAVLDLRDL